MFRYSKRSRVYSFCDALSGALIISSVIFAPWALGTVHEWSIRIMNLLAALLGVLLVCKFLARYHSSSIGRHQGHSNVLVMKESGLADLGRLKKSHRSVKWAGVLTAMCLVYILTSLLNFRSEFDPEVMIFSYRTAVNWLPHTFDYSATLDQFMMYFAMYLGFWSIRDWLKGNEAVPGFKSGTAAVEMRSLVLPTRVRVLLVTICINGIVLALVGILQRLSESEKLLWIYTPEINKQPVFHFGPYAYRGNAVAYMNLLWPITLFLFLYYREQERKFSRSRFGGGAYLLLVPGLVILGVAVLLANSRAGVIVFLYCAVLAVFCLRVGIERKRVLFVPLLVGLVLVFSVATWLGGDRKGSEGWVLDRLQRTVLENLEIKNIGRLDIYQHLGPLVSEAPIWGYGPGTFSSIYQMFRKETLEKSSNSLVGWSAWAHSDPIEYLITFGVAGTGLLALTFVTILSLPIVGGLYPISVAHGRLFYVGISGFCAQSLVDFPFQIYSLLHILSVVLSIVSVLQLSSETNGNDVLGRQA